MPEIIRYLDPDAVGLNNGLTLADAYTSIATWNTNEATNLVSDGDTHLLLFRASSGTIDTIASLDMSPWTAGAINFVTIRAIDGDQAVKTSYDPTRYRLLMTTGVGFIPADYTEVYGMQIENAFFKTTGIINISNVGILIDSCRFLSDGATSVIQSTDSGASAVTQNNILDHTGATGGSEGIYCQAGTIDSRHDICNGFDDAYERDAGTMTCTDDVALNTVAQDFDGTITVDHCASGSGTGTNAQTIIDPDLEFVDWANGDFTPLNTGVIYQNGIAISGLTLDMSGNLWNDPPTIGANEFEGGSQEVVIEPVMNEAEVITASLLSAKIISATVNESENMTTALLIDKIIQANVNESEQITVSLLTAKIITAIANESEGMTATLLTEKSVIEVELFPIVNESESMTVTLLTAKALRPVMNESENISATLKKHVPLFPIINESETITADLRIDSPTSEIATITMILSKNNIGMQLDKSDIAMGLSKNNIYMEMRK